VRFGFIADHRGRFPLSVLCDLLEVSRGGYYRWAVSQNRMGKRQEHRMRLLNQIRQVHQASGGVYGSPRVYHELKAQGVGVCENTVAKLMRQSAIRSVVKKRFRARTTDSQHAYPIAADRLERCFEQASPDRAWAADITYVPTDEGWLFLATIIDLCSRRIVGWSMADHLRSELCIEALQMALWRRRPGKGLVHHSDRGVQYACRQYRRMLQDHGIACSMSGRGDCYDNGGGEFFQDAEGGVRVSATLPYACRGAGLDLCVRGDLLQPQAAAFEPGLPKPGRI
jgi:putative transposase